MDTETTTTTTRSPRLTTLEWCRHRLKKLNEQNDELQRKVVDRQENVKKLQDKNDELKRSIRKRLKEGERRRTSGNEMDKKIARQGGGSKTRLSHFVKEEDPIRTKFIGHSTKKWTNGRDSFMGIAHIIQDILPKTIESKAHQMIPPNFLRNIQEEYERLRKRNGELTKKSDELRKAEAKREQVTNEHRHQLKTFVDVVGKDVARNVCGIQINDRGIRIPAIEDENRIESSHGKRNLRQGGGGGKPARGTTTKRPWH